MAKQNLGQQRGYRIPVTSKQWAKLVQLATDAGFTGSRQQNENVHNYIVSKLNLPERGNDPFRS